MKTVWNVLGVLNLFCAGANTSVGNYRTAAMNGAIAAVCFYVGKK